MHTQTPWLGFTLLQVVIQLIFWEVKGVTNKAFSENRRKHSRRRTLSGGSGIEHLDPCAFSWTLADSDECIFVPAGTSESIGSAVLLGVCWCNASPIAQVECVDANLRACADAKGVHLWKHWPSSALTRWIGWGWWRWLWIVIFLPPSSFSELL